MEILLGKLYTMVNDSETLYVCVIKTQDSMLFIPLLEISSLFLYIYTIIIYYIHIYIYYIYIYIYIIKTYLLLL